jgi:hypothetical protein
MPDVIGETWTLLRDDVVVGEIYVDDHEFPWYFGRFVEGEGFAELRTLFATEADLSERLLDAGSDEGLNAAWEAAYARIRQLVRLVHPAGHPVAEYLLHIDGDQAGFRWSDEPLGA